MANRQGRRRDPRRALNPGRESAASPARIEATRLGLDIRYVVTNITSGTAEWLYAAIAPAAKPRP